MRFRLGATALLTGALALAGVQGGAAGAHADGNPTPGNLAHLAAVNHMSTAKLSNILATDKTAHFDQTGHMYYVEPVPTIAPADATPHVAQSSTSAANVSTVPALSSRPSSTHKLYLDFNGVTVPSTSAWVTSGALAAGTYGGFDTDGDPSTYSPAEVAFITKVWRIVSEKYSPFDVDVTTVDPGPDHFSRTSAEDHNYGDDIVITSDASPVNQICSGQCAGVAYVDTYSEIGNAPYGPVWVFASKDFGSAQLAAHDAAHEAGHTFGLTHDGVTTVSGDNYYAGQGSWVPIMGLTDQNAIAQFSKGEYTNANNQQDDLAVIGANGDSGDPNSLLLTDDYPNTSSGSAFPLGAKKSYSVNGIISGATDDDIFSINRTCTNALTVTGTGIGVGQTLDMKIDIMDDSNNVLTSANPPSGETTDPQPDGDVGYTPTGMDATASLGSTTAGTTYRIRVSGTGDGDVLTTGYTNYGSIGQYHLAITGCPTTAPTARPVVTVSLSGRTATLRWTTPADPGGAILNGWTIHRSGPGTLPTDKTNIVGNTTTMTGLAIGTQTFTVTGNYTADDASNGVPSDPKSVSVAIKPGAPKIGTASSGAKRGPKTATARWSAPTSNGGASITSYKVVAYQLNSRGHVVKTFTSKALPGSARSYSWGLPGGHYKFRVIAYNRIGGSPYSGYSKVVLSR